MCIMVPSHRRPDERMLPFWWFPRNQLNFKITLIPTNSKTSFYSLAKAFSFKERYCFFLLFFLVDSIPEVWVAFYVDISASCHGAKLAILIRSPLEHSRASWSLVILRWIWHTRIFFPPTVILAVKLAFPFPVEGRASSQSSSCGVVHEIIKILHHFFKVIPNII